MAGINVGGIYSELVLKADKFYTGLKQAQNETSNFESKLKGVSNKATSTGKTLSTKLTAPIVGVGTAATLLGINFDASMSEVQAISGATGQDMVKLEDLAREMGATTKFSAKDASEGLKYMAMAGWNTQQMMDGLPGVLDLAAASGEDLGTTSDIVTDALTAFGMQASEASTLADLLASASSNSNTNVSLMGESFKYVAPVMGALGVSADDTALALGLMANAGIKGSQAGTQLRTMMNSLISPTDAAAATMKKHNIEIVKNADGSVNLKGTMDNLRDTLGGLDETQQAQAASTIFGREAMSGALAIINASEEDYQKLTDATTEYDGAAKDMAETMEGNLKGKINNIKSALEEAALKIYNLMLPSLESLADKIKSAVDWFNNLDESTQRNIVVMGGIAAAIGPVLLVVGSLSGAILKTVGVAKLLSGGMTALGGASTVAGTAIGGTVAPSWALGGAMKAGALAMNPWVLGAAAVAGGAYLIHKSLSEDAIPEVERFDDTVSDSTQEVVGNFMNMTEEANAQLKELSWGQQEVTAEMAEDMREKQQEITDTLLAAIDERHQEEIESTKEQFENIEVLDEEQKAKILERLDERFEEQQVKTEEGHERINEIISEAEKKGREITAQEAVEIERIRNEMTDTAIETMTQNEREQKVIYEKMKNNASIVSAQEAAEVVKNSKKKKDDVVKEANEQYDKTYAWAIQQRDELGTISDEEAEEIIAAAKEKRDESIENAEDMHKNVVKEAKGQAKDHVNEVDWETGEIKSKWGVMKDDISKKASTMKNNIVKYAKEQATQFTNKVGEMKTAASKKWENIRSDASDKFSRVKGFINNNINPASSNWGTKVSEMATKARTKFNSAKDAAKTAFSNIKTSIQGGIDKITAWNNKSVKNKVATFTQKVKTTGSKIISGLVGNNAHGTEYWGGGLTWVGEQGRELIDLPQGSKVYSNHKSERMATEGAGFTGSVLLDISIPLDGRELARGTFEFTAEELKKLQDRQRRGR